MCVDWESGWEEMKHVQYYFWRNGRFPLPETKYGKKQIADASEGSVPFF